MRGSGRGGIKAEPVFFRKPVDHVHDFELNADWTAGVRVPERDHTGVAFGIKQDQRTVAFDRHPVAHDPRARGGILVRAPAQRMPDCSRRV